MQSWIRLGAGIYAADQAREGFVKIDGYTFQGPVVQLTGGVFGGSALRFEGMEGASAVEEGMTEGWLSFTDGEFPEIKLTTVLQAKPGCAQLRHVISGEGQERLPAGSALTLAALLLPQAPRLYALELGAALPLPEEEGILPHRVLGLETPAGAILLAGGDFFAAANDGEGFCLAMVTRLEEDVALGEQSAFSTGWVRMAMADTLQAALAGAAWAR